MKKIVAFAVLLTMALTLCACVSEEEHNASVNQYAEENNRQAEEIRTLQEQVNQLNEKISQQEETIKTYMEQNVGLENTLNAYAWIINGLDNNEFESLINRLATLQKEKIRAELEAKGILEIEITLDNWDQYFEYVPHGYSYIKNSFGETTHVNMHGAVRLKEGYMLAEGYETRVDFEFTTQQEKRSCTVNFETLDITFGEVISTREARESSRTTTFNGNGSGVASFGSLAQLNNGKGNLITEEVEIEGITGVLRVQGTLRIYGK